MKKTILCATEGMHMFRKLVTVLVVGLLCPLFLTGVTTTYASNLVVNGGFETGTFAGWTSSEIEVYNGSAHSGEHTAIWQDSLQGSLSQTLTTVPGQSYTLDFWTTLGAGEDGDGSFFKVEFDGFIMMYTDLTDPANWSPNYKHFVFSVTGNGNDTLKFSFYSAESEGWLDDVSVSPVPIPGAVWLLASGLIGLAGLRKRFQN